MWYGKMCVHLYDLLDVLAAKATATTEATATTAAAKKIKEGARILTEPDVKSDFVSTFC